MAKFEIERTQRTLPGVGRAVRADLDVRTGGQFIGQAISAVGRAVQDIAIKMNTIQAQTEFDKAKRLSTEEINRLTLSFQGNLDPDTYGQELDSSVEKIRGFAPKNALAARWYKTWLDDRTPKWQMGVEESRWARITDNFKAEGFRLREQAKDTGDPRPYFAHIEQGKIFGIYTEEEAAKDKEIIGREAVVGRVNNLLNAGFSDVALKAINESELSSEEKRSLRRDVESEINRQRIEANRQQVEIQNQTRKEATDLMVDNKLTVEWLRENQQKMAGDDYERFNKYLMGLKEQVLTDVTAEETLRQRWTLISDVTDMLDEIRQGEGGLIRIVQTKMKLDSLAALGAQGVADAEQYRAKLTTALEISRDPDNPINTEIAKNYLRMLKETETDRVFSLDRVTNSIIYGRKVDALMNYFTAFKQKTGKDATGAEAQAFYEELVGDYRKPESPFTEARVQQMLGELQSGGAVSIYGMVIDFAKAEDAVNHALRTLGPDWQKIAPDAARIIKQKWPEAKLEVVEPKPTMQYQIGQRIVHPNGGIYEYTGKSGDKAWRLVKE